jgi:hypothetical protein
MRLLVFVTFALAARLCSAYVSSVNASVQYAAVSYGTKVGYTLFPCYSSFQ